MVKKLIAVSRNKQEVLKTEYSKYSRTLHETEQQLNRAETVRVICDICLRILWYCHVPNLIQLTCSIRLFSIMEFTTELEGFCWKHQGRYRRFNVFSFFTSLPHPPTSTSFFREAVFIRRKVAEKKPANLFLPVLIFREVATPDVFREYKKFGSTPPSVREVGMILSFAGSPCPTRA